MKLILYFSQFLIHFQYYFILKLLNSIELPYREYEYFYGLIVLFIYDCVIFLLIQETFILQSMFCFSEIYFRFQQIIGIFFKFSFIVYEAICLFLLCFMIWLFNDFVFMIFNAINCFLYCFKAVELVIFYFYFCLVISQLSYLFFGSNFYQVKVIY